MHARPSRFEQFQELHAFVCGAAASATGAERQRLAGLSSFVFNLAREDQERERLALVFRSAGGGLWEIGEAGATRLVAENSLGVPAAHRALLGERPASDKVIARAVKETAATWAQRAGCPRLAAVIQRIAVRAGRLEYLAGPRPPVLVLR